MCGCAIVGEERHKTLLRSGKPLVTQAYNTGKLNCWKSGEHMAYLRGFEPPTFGSGVPPSTLPDI